MKNNKFVILFTFFIITLFIPNFVHAEVYSCPKLLDSVSEYYDINEELDTLVCENTDDNDVVMKCNDLNTRKALLLSKIFKYNDKIGDTCNSPELRKIIEDNQSICKNAFGSTLKDLTNSVMTLFYIIAPFLLIIFGSIDLAKIVTGGGGKEFSEQLTKSKKNLAKRVIAFVLLYMTPVVVNIILGFNLSSYSLTGDFYTCKTKTTYTLDRWEVTYIPNNNSSSGNVSVTNWHTDWFQGDDRWGGLPWHGDGAVAAGGCGSLATSIVASHYSGNDTESSPYYPVNTAKEYYNREIQPNLRSDAITKYFNEWHPELGLKATYVLGDIDYNYLDSILAKGGCVIADFQSDITYNGVSIWTSGGHYVTIIGGNQHSGYRVADSNGSHENGFSGIAEWAPYGQHVFEKEYIKSPWYFYVIEKL